MKCPRCGNEMMMDSHRRIPLQMCYECGYIEGQSYEPIPVRATNFEHLKKLNFNETVAFLSAGLGIEEEVLADWLEDSSD